MGIITKEVEVKVNSNNVQYYKELGYEIPMKKASMSTYKRSGKEFVYDFSKSIIVKVKDLLAKQLRLDVATIEDDANNLDDLGADSLEIVEMLMTLESEFGITVPDEDVMGLKTVRLVAEYLESHT